IITPQHQVKLMDFGLAHLLDENMTPSGVILGTPHYAAPEQLKPGRAGPAADLYALGVMIYEGATGQHPFPGQTLYEVMLSHIERAPKPVGALNPQVTPFLEEVVACLLEKEPADRFSGAGEVASVLEEGDRSAWWHGHQRALRATRLRSSLRRVPVSSGHRLVGRVAELDAIRASWQRACTGVGSLVLIEGEAG